MIVIQQKIVSQCTLTITTEKAVSMLYSFIQILCDRISEITYPFWPPVAAPLVDSEQNVNNNNIAWKEETHRDMKQNKILNLGLVFYNTQRSKIN